MADFYGEQETICSAIRNYGVNPDEINTFQKLNGGIENDVFKITFNQNTFVLRRYRNRHVEDIRFECKILKIIYGKFESVRTPNLWHTVDNCVFLEYAGNLFTVYEYLCGSHPQSSNLTLINSICRFVEDLQRISRFHEWNENIKRFDTHDVLTTANQLVNQSNIFNGVDWMLYFEEEIDRIDFYASILQRFPKTIIHGDLNRRNILIDQEGKLSAILDFDDAHVDYSILEFAGIARSHCFDNNFSFDEEKCHKVFENIDNFKHCCSFREFVEVVRYFCFRYFVYILEYHFKNINKELWTEASLSNLHDFKRWRSLVKSLECNTQIIRY